MAALLTIRYIGWMDRSGLAGDLISRARGMAGLTQTELALRSGISQSVLSVYESGRRQPSMPTLLAIIDATGIGLEIQLSPARSSPPPMTTALGRLVSDRRSAIQRTAAKVGVQVVGVFGSVARGEDGPDSDVDLLVELPTEMGLFGMMNLESELTALLGRHVDLVPEAELKPAVREKVLADLVML